MKCSPKKDGRGRLHTKSSEQILDEGDSPWYSLLDANEITDKLPNMSHAKGQTERIQMPVHNSTVTIATQIREQYPEKFRINLDVYRSMLYAGRQLFDWCYLKNSSKAKKSKAYQLAKIMEELDSTTYDVNFVEELLKRLLEGYLSQGQGTYSRDNILAKIEEIRPLISEELNERCDIFIDEELDSEVIKRRVTERLRKRDQRERKKNIHLVNS